MKKNINRIFLFIIAVCAFASCKKQTEEYNPSGATVESLFTTPEGFESAVNGAYTYNRSLYGKEEGYALLEMGTDIWTAGANNGTSGANGVYPQPSLTNYQGLDASNVWVKTKMYQPCYAAINLINTSLKYIDKSGLDAARKPVLEGELRFLRAWYYWHLVETFGDVPFTLEPTETMVTTATRTPVDSVYAQIFTDMNVALNQLPISTGDYGRVTKPIAEAFMARLLLTRGKNQEASDYANKVISNYHFRLLDKYSDLWRMDSQQNPEVLWAVNYSTNLAYNAGSNVAHALFLMDYNTQPGMVLDVKNGYPYVRYMPTLFLLNLFNEQDDARFDASFQSVWYANEPDPAKRPAGMNLNDTAIVVSKNVIPASQRTGKVYRIYDVNDVYDPATGLPRDRSHYLSLKKFNDPTRATESTLESARDAFTIRLAEMYLIAGEAQFKLGKLDSAAYFINKLRTRAAVPGHQEAMQIAPGDVSLDFILDEYAREFAGEQMRWFTLKRTGKLVERVKADNPDAAPYIQSFHERRPIPQAEIDAVTNKDQFKQNEGY